LALSGEEIPFAMLTKCGMWGDMKYAIFGECQLRSVGVARGVTLPSPIDLKCCSVTLPCDRVIYKLVPLSDAPQTPPWEIFWF